MSQHWITNFNINDYVQVKLTEYGRTICRKWSITPVEDADGWVSFQMHIMMNVFGPYISLGLDLPFETTIRLVSETRPTGILVTKLQPLQRP